MREREREMDGQRRIARSLPIREDASRVPLQGSSGYDDAGGIVFYFYRYSPSNEAMFLCGVRCSSNVNDSDNLNAPSSLSSHDLQYPISPASPASNGAVSLSFLLVDETEEEDRNGALPGSCLVVMISASTQSAASRKEKVIITISPTEYVRYLGTAGKKKKCGGWCEREWA